MGHSKEHALLLCTEHHDDRHDGLLSIELVREIPDAMKPRKIEINGGERRTIEADAPSEPLPERQEERAAA